MPSHIAACFAYPDVPATGPYGPQEAVSHLWYGWGWAVGSMVAGMAGGQTAAPALPPPASASATGKKQEATGGAAASTAPSAPASAGGSALTLVLRDHVCPALGVPSQASFGLIQPPQPPVPTNPDGTTNVAALPPPPLPPFPTLCLGASGALDAVPREGEEEESPSTTGGAASSSSPSAADDHVSAEDEDVTMTAAMAAVELAETMAAGGLTELATLTGGGKEHFMDPRFVNMEKVRNALLPATNLYASAMALARMGAFIAAHGAATHAGAMRAQAFAPAPAPSPASGGGNGLMRCSAEGPAYEPTAVLTAHNLGLRLFGWRDRPAADADGGLAGAGAASTASSVSVVSLAPAATDSGKDSAASTFSALSSMDGGDSGAGISGSSSSSSSWEASFMDPAVQFTAFGASALGGSTLIVDTAKGVAIAVTVNKLAADRALTRHIVEMVASEMKLGSVVDL